MKSNVFYRDLTERLARHPLVLFSDFRKLFAGRLISAVGDKFFLIALSWWVLNHSGANSRFHLGLLMAVNLAPIVLFGPFMGLWADRLNRRTCMVIADAGRSFFMLALSVLLWLDALDLLLLYAICFGLAVFVPLFESAADSSLSRLVDAAHLPGATAIGASVVGISSVVGAALAGCLLALLGVLGAFILNALSFLLSLLLVLNLRADLRPQSLNGSESYFRQLRQGFAYILDRPGLTALLACFALINFFAAPMLIFVPMIVKDLLRRSAAWVGILETCIALGTISAAFSMSFLRLQNVYRRFFGGLLLAGLATLGIGLTRQAYAIAGLLFAFGWALGLINSTALAVFQAVVPDAIKGRFFALLNTLCFAVMPLTLMLNGFLSQCFDFSVVLAVNGAAILVIALALPWIPRLPAVSASAPKERANPA